MRTQDPPEQRATLDLRSSTVAFNGVESILAELFEPQLGCDLCDLLYPSEAQIELVGQQLDLPYLTQPVLLVFEYALAQLWIA